MNSVGLRDETSAGKVGTMPLSGAATLVFLGGIIYAMLSGDRGSGALVLSFGVVLLGLERLSVAQSRPDRAIGWVLLLYGMLTIMFTAPRMALSVTYSRLQ